jgi:hypothetical protein
MSNQEIKNQGNTKEKAAVDKRRRFIKGAGIAAPVVLTLSSPSVFGALCLSQIMSGNESHIGADKCTLGQNPAYWSDPANKQWPSPYAYSDNANTKMATQLQSSCSSYSGGTTFSEAFGGRDIRPMREILCENPDSSESRFVAALLNANKDSDYVLTSAQVIDLWNNGSPKSPPPGYADLGMFLASTWTS